MPGQIGPKHIGPKHIGPKHIGPEHIGPEHIGPEHIGPKHIGPEHIGPEHIGIVGCSAVGAALCYRTICIEGEALLGPHRHPEVSMHTHPLADYVACLDRGDIAGVGELMLSSARKLAAAGADFLICPDNTIHQAMNEVRARSPLPWLHIAEIVAAEALRRGFRRVALTGTRWLVESSVYPEKLSAVGLELVVPPAEALREIDRVIKAELVRGILRPESALYFQHVMQRMREQYCDAVILGCTELPLIAGEHEAPLPTLDSTRLLARAALHRAIGLQGR